MIKNKIIYNVSSAFRFKLSKAQDSYLWDEHGKKLIDFTSGWNVTNLGWNNSEITNAIIHQAKKNTYASMWTMDPIQEKYAEYLSSFLPKGLDAFSREIGGVNANVMAIKAARAYTGKKKILGFSDSFHGSLYGVLEICYKPDYLISKSVFLDYQNYVQIDFPKVRSNENKKNQDEVLKKFSDKIDKILSKKDFAAMICEAGIVSGWGSVYMAPDGFLKTIRKLTKKHGVLLILDEVGTGFSRLGKLFGMQIENIAPDFATFAKGMSNGALPIATMVTTSEIANEVYSKTQPQSTFGWNPIAVAAALKTLQIHSRDRVWEKAQKDGDYLMKTLKSELHNNSLVDEIRGMGMEIGVIFKKEHSSTISAVLEKAFTDGLHMRMSDGYGFQLMPPLTIERSILDKGIEILVRTIKSFS